VQLVSEPFAVLADGRAITRWTVTNASGAGFTVMDLGATILTLSTPDRADAVGDVVFGFDTAEPYLSKSPYFGAIVGRFANRIAEGRFTLDGQTYQLAINNPPNTLHGGRIGFDKRVWSGETVTTEEGAGVRFTLVSADGDEGYPGEVRVTVTYLWNDDNALIVDYTASTTRPSPFNIAQHTYWNLAGSSASTLLDHQLWLNADSFTPVNSALIPTGEIRAVQGTPFDFREAKPIGRDIEANHEQLRFGRGFDHNWVLNGEGMREAAWLYAPSSGRTLTIETDQPGIQFYSGNFLDGTVTGKGGTTYAHRSAIALETQYFPDSPNQPGFPDAILRPGKDFQSRTVFRFGVAE
jgi:aldose 1-epimerase